MGLIRNQLVVFVDKNSDDVDASIREIARKYCSFAPETADGVFFIFSHQLSFDNFNRELLEKTGFGFH